jgi:hypothetical protein
MSYDYSLFVPPGPGPMSSWTAASLMPLGTLEEVERRLSASFPEMAWQRSGGASFGRSRLPEFEEIEFQLTPDADGLCRALTVRRITRRQVEELCRMLGVVAVDSQKVELIRPWHDGEQG